MAPLIILMYALFASSFIFGKILVGMTTPFFLTGIRMFIAGVLLLSYQYFWKKHTFTFPKDHLWLYTQIIVMGIYFAYALRFWGLDYLSASKTALLFNASPFYAAFYSYIFFKERLTKKQWLGLFIGICGLIPILITSSAEEQNIGEFLFLSWPEIAILVSVGLHSYSWICVRKLIKSKKQDIIVVNGITMLCAGILALVTSPLIEGPQSITDWYEFGSTLAAVILVSNVICFNLYGYLLKHYSPTLLSFAGFLVPIFTAFYSWILWNITLTWHFYLSMIIVFIGLYIFYQDELKQALKYS